MQAKDIMTKEVLCVKMDTSIKEAIRLCVHHQISGLIVINDQEEIMGVVSEKDMLVAYDFLRDIKGPIRDFVSKDVIAVAEDATLDEINRILVQKNIKRVPVLRGKKVIGVVARRDILRFILENT